MLKHRLIPCVLMRNGLCVQSKGFKRYQALGNPFTIVERLSDWASDELIYLDITRGGKYDLRRDDTNFPNRSDILDIIKDVARRTFMPLTVGGGIRTLRDAEDRLASGADKIATNTQAAQDPQFITDCAREFGSQCVVLSIDVRATGDDWEVYAEGGTVATTRNPIAWALQGQDRGAGEIFLTSIDRDGRGAGYDLKLIEEISRRVTIPVIACGGVGKWEDLADGIKAGADAVAAANIFHYTENSVYHAKRHLIEEGLRFRKEALHEEGL